MIEETLQQMLEPEVVAAGCELWGIEYVDHAKSVILKIYIEKHSGVTVDDCARVSDQVSAVLDVDCLLYTSPSPRDRTRSRMPSSA